MKKQETAEILKALKNAFPLFYSNAKNNFGGVIDIWHEHIGRYDYGVVKTAIHNLIGAETFIPTIATVKKYIESAVERQDNISEDGDPHPDGGVWYQGKQMLGVKPCRR